MLFFRSLMVGNRNLVRDLIGIVLALAVGLGGQLLLSDPMRVLAPELPVLSPQDWPGSQFFGPLRIEGGRPWSDQRAFQQSIALIRNEVGVAEATQRISWYADLTQAAAAWDQHKSEPFWDFPIVARNTGNNKPESLLLCSTPEPDISPLCSYRAYWEHWYTEVTFTSRTIDDLPPSEMQKLTNRIDQLLMSAPDKPCQGFFCKDTMEAGNEGN